MGRRDRDTGWSDGGALGWATLASFPTPAHVLSGDGVIVEANLAFERLFGAPRTAFRGRHQATLCDGTSAARRRLTTRILAQAAARGSWKGTLPSRGSDGRRFTTRAHVFPARVDGRRYFVCLQNEAGGERAGAGTTAGALSRWHLAAPG